MDHQLKLRSQIAEEYKWRLEDIFPDDAHWEKTFQWLRDRLPELAQFNGNFTQTPAQLVQFLEKMHTAEEALGKLFAYAHMRNDEDKSNPTYQKLYDRARQLLVEYQQTVSFFEPQLLALEQMQLEQWLHDEPKLELYRHFFDTIFRRKAHTLSEKEERLLAMAGEVLNVPEQIFSVWESADIVFPEITDSEGKTIRLTEALYGKFQQSPDRRLRKDSYMALYVPFIEHRNLLAANYSGMIKSHIFQARARKYTTTMEAALDANAIPVQIYANLVDATRQNLEPLHHYNKIRQKVLNLSDGVHDYDLRAPLFEHAFREYDWEEAKALCLEGLAPLGDEYVTTLKTAFEQRWIDVFENKGKRTGAYSSGTYGVHPYVLMNYNGSLGDVFTLAHEMGHAMHTWYTINHQPFVYGDYPIFLAEVASTTNEALLQLHLIERATDKTERLAYLNAYLDKFSQTFYRQVLFAEFEWKTHQMLEQGQPLTADALDALFGEIYSAYHGPVFTLDRETKALWSRVPHFYYNYYVFQYSTSFVAATALAALILKEGASSRERYLNFLKSGNSKYAVETLKDAGIDLTSPEPVQLSLQLMNELLNEVEGLI